MRKIKFDLTSGEQIEVAVDFKSTPEAQANRVLLFRKKLIAEAKAEARCRILAIVPEWKQANATARAVEIVNKRLSGTATPADLEELSKLAEVLAVVKSIRAASDLIEEDIAAGLVISVLQIKSSERWPTIE